MIDHVTTFKRIEDCVQFLAEEKEEKVFIVSSGSLGPELVQQINGLSQVHSIYIFCGGRARRQSWASKWSKIKEVEHRIGLICESLREEFNKSSDDSNSTDFAVDDDPEEHAFGLNQLDPSFMYFKLFKQVFLKMEQRPDERQPPVQYC